MFPVVSCYLAYAQWQLPHVCAWRCLSVYCLYNITQLPCCTSHCACHCTVSVPTCGRNDRISIVKSFAQRCSEIWLFVTLEPDVSRAHGQPSAEPIYKSQPQSDRPFLHYALSQLSIDVSATSLHTTQRSPAEPRYQAIAPWLDRAVR